MVNVIVCMKRVPDTESVIKISDDGKSIDKSTLEYIVNPYDEFAIEEALKITEEKDGEVTVVCLGPADSTKEIRTGLAMGAHKAIHLKDEADSRDALSTATILAEAIKGLDYDLVLFGKQAVDQDNGSVGLMVATLLGIPAVSEIVACEMGDGAVTVKRDVEGGANVYEVPLPAVLTAQKGLNEPRYASLKGIMKAKKKPVDSPAFEEVESRIAVRKIEPPPMRAEGKIVGEGPEAVKELVRLLREEAKLI